MGESNNFHAGSRASQDYLYDPTVATPSHAERARTLAAQLTRGTLCTVSHAGAQLPGHPYGSLVTTALCDGAPVFLISGLAEHTKNLRGDGRASLLLSEGGADNPLALGRLTLLGTCREFESPPELVKQTYLDAHPDAAYYLEYGDFKFWQLEVEAVRYIGGFGRMSWVGADEWRAAQPDPLAPAADRIIEHMNDDHVDAMAAYCRAFSKAKEFSAVKMTGVDRYGFEMSVDTADGWRPVRLAFDAPVADAGAVRAAMVELVARARAELGTT